MGSETGQPIPRPIPKEISRSGSDAIRILWRDGHESVYSPRPLRLKCPCAGCVDEWTGRRTITSGDVSEDVVPLSVNLVGRYGVRIHWSDGHSDGIYTFELLRGLCPCPVCNTAGTG